MPVRKIRFRRGNQTNLPSLDAGEPGFALDTNRFYIGGSSANVEIATKSYVDGEIENVLRIVSVPSTKFGLAGDLAGDVAYNSSYLYICIQNYTNGSAQIWERVLFDSTW
jgi:hypothetical protein